jgi:hypothetical protein
MWYYKFIKERLEFWMLEYDRLICTLLYYWVQCILRIDKVTKKYENWIDY